MKRPIRFAAPAAVLAAVSSTTMTDSADAAQYLKVPDVQGDATLKLYKDWIEVLAWSWGFAAPQPAAAVGATRTRGELTFGPLNVVVGDQGSAVQIAARQLGSATLGTVQLDIVDAAGVLTGQLELEEVIVTAISGGGENNTDVTTQISFDFTQIEYRTLDLDSKGAPVETARFCWNIETASKC